MHRCACGSLITNNANNIAAHNRTQKHTKHIDSLKTQVKPPVVKQNTHEEFNIIVDLYGANSKIEEFKFSAKVLLTIMEKRIEMIDFTQLSKERFRKITDIVLEKGITSNTIIASKIREYVAIPLNTNIEILQCQDHMLLLTGLDAETFHLINTIIFNIIKIDIEKFNQLRAQCCNETVPGKIRRLFLMIIGIISDNDTLNDILTNQYGDLHEFVSNIWDKKINNANIRYIVCEYSDKL